MAHLRASDPDSQIRPPVSVSDIGFTELWAPPNAAADIIFIHGLQGHPRRTWTYGTWIDPKEPPSRLPELLGRKPSSANTANETTCFWPGDLLPKDFPDCRIAVYGYDFPISNFFSGATSRAKIASHGESLIYALESLRRGTPTRPIVFVAHSLGGLILKEALRRSWRDQSYKQDLHTVYGSTAAVVFMGTPHRGSENAPWDTILRSTAAASDFDTSDQYLWYAKINSLVLPMLSEGYSEMMMEETFDVHTLIAGKGFEGFSIEQGLIGKATEDAFTVGYHTREHRHYINANHIEMCRFSGPDDPDYGTVKAVLLQCLGVPRLKRLGETKGYPEYSSLNFSSGKAATTFPNSPLISSPEPLAMAQERNQEFMATLPHPELRRRRGHEFPVLLLDSGQVVEQFISLVTNKRVYGPLFQSAADSLELTVFFEKIIVLLRDYCYGLLQEAGGYSQSLVCIIIRNHVSDITHRVCAKYYGNRYPTVIQLPDRRSDERRETNVQTRSEAAQRTLQHTGAEYKRPLSGEGPDWDSGNDARLQSIENADWQDYVDYKTQLSKIYVPPRIVRQFLVAGRSFGRLRLGLRQLIGQDIMMAIRQEVYFGLSFGEEEGQAEQREDIWNVEILVHWSLREYVERELEYESGSPDLKRVLAVTGNTQDAFATTCAKYVQWLWPDLRFDLVEAVNTVLRKGTYRKSIPVIPGLPPYKPADSDKVSLFSRPLPSTDKPERAEHADCTVLISGPQGFITSVAQQLAWLTAAFRVSSMKEPTCSLINFMWVSGKRFELRPAPGESAKLLKTEEDVCWHPLLDYTTIAGGFPIPSREGQRGVELPFDTMMFLARTQFAATCRDRLALCGFSTLLYPTATFNTETSDGTSLTSVQWHLETRGDPHLELTLGNVLAKSQDRWLVTQDQGAVVRARTFVGYCGAAHVNLGTENASYRTVDESNLPDDHSKPGVRIKQVTTGTSGLGFWTATTSADIVYPKQLSKSASVDSYDDILVCTRKMSIILYDAKTKLGWLVPAQKVLLHLAQLWILEHAPGKKLTYSQPGLTTLKWWRHKAIDQADEDILRGEYKLELRKSLDDDKEFYLRDLIKQFWADLQGCAIARKQWREEAMGDVEAPVKKLCGWELLDFINRPTEFKMKEESLSFSGCGWDLLTKDRDVWVLVCQNLGNVIEPAPTIDVCGEWKPVPPSKRYLVASMSCLLHKVGLDNAPQPSVPRVNAHQGNEPQGGAPPVQVPPVEAPPGDEKIARAKIINQVFWHPSDHLLLHGCNHPPGPCSRTPEKLSHKNDGKIYSLTQLPPGGAVVFGGEIRKLQKPPPQNSQIVQQAGGKNATEGGKRRLKFKKKLLGKK